ncbi:ADP-glyceromanno-heptose 6-epimerase [Paracoccus benzoatiresistens]|uniref:ADP-L-glycero-D-manno-heptose-6-epimerase n=1 Tax=Paracoccus benzoatiresistens TaxID=2997341 RepID=A0ABT4J9C4_9RHOB|nr:ADP-glyceromanno-heptose 6-epimerase [Paracoccus sp. EF6]MCZ0963689.1 ADP-glyceromanno-heptose 6-epimerase [Paracoccus sp. EF6]
MILITGAAGFIGSNIVADLEEACIGPVAVCDWFEDSDKWRNLAKRDITEFIPPNEIFDWLRGRTDITGIVHMGAISATTERNVDLLVERNITMTVKLWDWCANAEVPFIYASSAATYGALEKDLVDSQKPEDLAALRPLNGYGWSKNATDKILMRRVANGEKCPPQWAGLKFFNVYGPNEYHKGSMMSVVAKFFEPVRTGEIVRLFKSDRTGIADGQQMRDFVYVKDCTAAIIWLLRNPSVSGLFNIGTGNARSFDDLVRAIGLALSIPVKIEYIDMPENLKGRYQYFTQAEMTKLRKSGFEAPFHSLEAGVRDYVNSYLNTEDCYR